MEGMKPEVQCILRLLLLLLPLSGQHRFVDGSVATEDRKACARCRSHNSITTSWKDSEDIPPFVGSVRLGSVTLLLDFVEEGSGCWGGGGGGGGGRMGSRQQETEWTVGVRRQNGPLASGDEMDR